MRPQKYIRTIRHTPLDTVPWADEKDFIKDGLTAIAVTAIGFVVALGLILGSIS